MPDSLAVPPPLADAPEALPLQPPPATGALAAPLVDEERIRQLGEDGHFVIDSLLGLDRARELRAEAHALAHAGALRPAGMSRGDAFRLERASRGDEIAWLDPTQATPALRCWLERLEALRDEVNEGAWLGLRRYEVQVARYAGGGRGYVRHCDAFPGGPNRSLTAIYYLNEGWEPAHGGMLRIYPPDRPPIEIAPAIDRLVVFLSSRLEHEVLPTLAERLAITAWFYGREEMPR